MEIPFIAPNVVDPVKELEKDLAYFFPELTHFYGYATTPDHDTRRCLDAMVYDSSNKYVTQQGRKNLPYADRIALGNRVNAFIRKNANHYHVNGVIWNRHVWGFPHDGGTGGRHYAGPAGVARPYTITAHDDHNHIELDGRPFTPLRPTKPVTWDGHSFPGAAAFYVGAHGDYVTLLGQRLVAHGWTGYADGPGPDFSATDQAGVKWFQQLQGWTGPDADGFPGAQTWALLMAGPAGPAPKPAPAPKPNPLPTPTSEDPAVTTIRVATFNVLKDTAGSPFAARVARDVKAMKDSKASVFFLQECDGAQAAAVQDKMGSDFIWARGGANVVMVDKTVWTMTHADDVYNLPTPYSTGSTKLCPLVQLTHGNLTIAVTSAHPSATLGGDPDKMSEERRQQVVYMVKKLKPYPKVVGGMDGNSSSLSPGKPKRILLDAGYSLLTQDPDFQSKNVDSHPNNTPGGQQIDEIFVRGLTITDGAIIDAGAGSDHNLEWAELTVKR